MDLDAADDDALVARAGAGDRAAASVLIARHTDRVMAVCFRMLGDRPSAEDAAQETFLRLWRKAGDWRPGRARFQTWLYRVASNICIDRLRRRKREAPEDAAPEQADPSPAADVALVEREAGAKVMAALAQLPERQRLAIVLSHFEDRSNIESAEIMGVSVEAVESLLGRARRTLRAALAEARLELMEEGAR